MLARFCNTFDTSSKARQALIGGSSGPWVEVIQQIGTLDQGKRTIRQAMIEGSHNARAYEPQKEEKPYYNGPHLWKSL